jgi:peptidoglycan-N-acetylglucosamine deacetylase
VFRRALTRSSLLCAIILAFAASSRAGPKAAPVDHPLAGTRVAITIDDIPDHGSLSPGMSRKDIALGLIKALQDNQVNQAFGFTNGSFLPENPNELDILKLWLNAGYPLGNHTYDHPDLNTVGAKAFIANIAKQEHLLATLSDYSPLLRQRFMFRYPYLDEGDTLEKRDEVRAYLAQHGYQIAEVTTDYYDWAWTDAYTRCLGAHDEKSIDWMKANIRESADQHLRASNEISMRLFGHRIPHVLLMHDGAFDLLTLDGILKQWRAQGVQVISLKEALADPVYAINPNYAYKDGMNFLEQIANARHVDIDDLEPSAYSIDQLNEICKTAPAH